MQFSILSDDIVSILPWNNLHGPVLQAMTVHVDGNSLRAQVNDVQTRGKQAKSEALVDLVHEATVKNQDLSEEDQKTRIAEKLKGVVFPHLGWLLFKAGKSNG